MNGKGMDRKRGQTGLTHVADLLADVLPAAPPAAPKSAARKPETSRTVKRSGRVVAVRAVRDEGREQRIGYLARPFIDLSRAQQNQLRNQALLYPMRRESNNHLAPGPRAKPATSTGRIVMCYSRTNYNAIARRSHKAFSLILIQHDNDRTGRHSNSRISLRN